MHAAASKPVTTVSPQYYEGYRAALGGGDKNGHAAPASTSVLPACPESLPEAVQPEPEAALSDEERIKRELHPLDVFPRLLDCAQNDRPPREDDRFRFRWFGLFYQGPLQDAFVLRLRLPGGRLRAHQLAGLAALAQEWAGGCVVCNAQGGLDVPGVPVRATVEALRRVEEIGLRSMLSGGDCVWAVRGGEYEGLTDRSHSPVIYPLVRELELALAMDHRMADLPAGCEVAFCGSHETAPGSEADGGIVVFRMIDASSGNPADAGGPGFSLVVPGFGALNLTLTVAQVVPACLELLGKWARQGVRAGRPGAGIAGFCESVGNDRLREWLAGRTGTPAVASPRDAGAGDSVAARPVGVPVPEGCLLSGALERLADVAHHHGSNEVRLAGGQLFVPCDGDRTAAEAALRGALDRR